MCANKKGQCKMMTADDAREAVRPPLVSLVDHQVAHGAARMDAYQRVAGMIGRSRAWVRRVVGRDEHITVGLHDALNIRAAYDRLCTRIEDAAERIEAEALSIERQSDAVRDRRPEPAARSPAPSTRPRRRPDVQFRRAVPAPVLMAA